MPLSNIDAKTCMKTEAAGWAVLMAVSSAAFVKAEGKNRRPGMMDMAVMVKTGLDRFYTCQQSSLYRISCLFQALGPVLIRRKSASFS